MTGAATEAGHQASLIGQLRVRPLAEGIGYALFAAFVFFTCFTFLKPSPYDFAAIPAMAIWLALGLRIHRGAVVFGTLVLLYQISLFVALIPYLPEPNPLEWTLQSAYLVVTSIFFVMFFTEETNRRVGLAFKAYTAGCLFAAVAGIMSYFDLPNGEYLFKMDGRAAGVFEDPNVLGSFLILGLLFCLRGPLTGTSRRPILSMLCALVIATAIFLSFSRGSWGATVVAVGLLAWLAYRSSGGAVRRRIVTLAVGVAVLGSVLIAGLLSVPQVAERFEDRATVTKDYDEGETGRFGNQRRSIPMLLERPGGFGPLRFRLTFGLEPHNSYIGGFANGGWMGGFAFLGLVLTTTFVGSRLCLVASPYRGLAQVVWPALFVFFLQALQIDIDHWRHVYLMFGVVSGLECARLRWVAGTAARGQPISRGVESEVRSA